MFHVVIDTSIYSSDRARHKGPFRALTRILVGQKAQLHVPYVVKHEFISQREDEVRKEINNIKDAIYQIAGSTAHAKVSAFVERVQKDTKSIKGSLAQYMTEEFEAWLTECHAIVHRPAAEHGKRIAEDYFKGAPPFKAAKNRNDIPDSFVWHTMLDLSQKHKPMHVVANDGALYKAASGNKAMLAYNTLDEFINTKECQNALKALTEEVVAENMERAGQLLSTVKTTLGRMVNTDIIDALHGKSVSSDEIPDDNNEAMILSVYEPHELSFDFDNVDYYGESDIGVPFEALVECEVNYAIFKSDYFTLSEEKMKRISIGERNDHYFDADETYEVNVEGTLSLTLDAATLKGDETSDDEIGEAIKSAEHDLEITEITIPDGER